MRVPVDRLHRQRVGAVRQAKGRPAIRIEPIGDVAHAVLLFDLHIAGVRDGEVHGRDAGDIVAVQEQRQSYLRESVWAKPARSG